MPSPHLEKSNLNHPRSLALLTDLYQLTMAAGYCALGMAEREAVFYLTFRSNPFGGGYAIACGLDSVIDYIRNFEFLEEDLDYLAHLRNPDGSVLFNADFLSVLKRLRLRCDMDAVVEGSIVFSHQPILRVQGPIMQCQLLETVLLNCINFQTLIATKAARIVQAANGDPVMEFGLRRAHGVDGGITASRSAYVGGCSSTSNVIASKLYGIPVCGTHAHSWVMSFNSECEAFSAYADALPNHCVFLVDTYDTIEGVRNAIRTGNTMRERNVHLSAIRIDSGDLAYLSITARQLLDSAGFCDTKIIASNNLDEIVIESLKSQGARIDIWGVGNRLITAHNQSSLGGVYKLSAIRTPCGKYEDRIKVSEQAIKTSIPGRPQVWRCEDHSTMLADIIVNENQPPALDSALTMVDPLDHTKRHTLPRGRGISTTPLLQPIFRNGECIYRSPDATAIRTYAQQQLQRLHPTIRRFVNPHTYPVGLEQQLHERRTALILKMRKSSRQ